MWILGWSALAFALSESLALSAPPRAAATPPGATPPAPPRPSCDAPTLKARLDAFKSSYANFDPNVYAGPCSSVENNDCVTIPDPRVATGTPPRISLCRLANEMMEQATRDYVQSVETLCGHLPNSYDSCNSGGAQTSSFSCIGKAATTNQSEEAAIAGRLQQSLDNLEAAIARRQQKLDEAIQKFTSDRTALAAATPGAATLPLKCGKENQGTVIPMNRLMTIASSGDAVAQLNAVKTKVEQFKAVAAQAQTYHKEQATHFASQARSMSSLQGRMAPPGSGNPTAAPGGQPTKAGSDITGTDKTAQGGGGSQGGGGGGESGGGQGGGGQGGGEQGPPGGGGGGEGGATSATPIAGNSGARDHAGADSGSSADNAKKSPGGSAPLPGLDDSSKLAGHHGGSPSGLGGFSPLSSSMGESMGGRGLASSGSQASHASASGGGGGASIGGDSSGSHCMGKDCQALGNGAAFGGLGSLGSAPALGGLDGGGGGASGMGSLDSGSSLDNLFKNDNKKDAAGGLGAGGLDAGLANLDASTASLEAGADAAGGAQGGTELGSRDEDLFARLHNFHERAQKRGLVVGLTRKL
ncbi:MAG: hypothetical protein ACXVCS_10000 [Bdellovibrionota bacterium]